jgi:hypothetical protein
MEYAGTGDDAAKWAEALFTGGDCGADVVFTGDVGFSEECALGELIRYITARRRAVGDDHAGAKASQLLDASRAQAGAAAGDQDG